MKGVPTKYYLLLGLCLLLYTRHTNAQLSEGGIPEGIKNNGLRGEVIELSVPLMSVAKELSSRKPSIHRKSLKFAYDIPVSIDPTNYGTWIQKENLRIWTITIKSSGAKSLSLTFENYHLKEGEKLFVYNASAILGAFTSEYNSQEILATQHIKGDMITIEFSSPYAVSGTFTIKKVAHAYLDIFDEAGPCHININCPEGAAWQTEKQSVAKIVMNGVELCSGALINNSANDGKAYLLTANHCISSDFIAARSVFFFNYESANCSDNKSTYNHAISGAKIRSTSYEHDFTLLELNRHPPVAFQPYYAGWNLEEGDNLNGVVSIHHPWGAVKKISIENDKVTTSTYVEEGEFYAQNAFWFIKHWDKGTTEDGSSGSPLFDNNHLIIGSLTGGAAYCAMTDSDYYEKLSTSFFTQPRFETDTLGILLDPLKTGTQKLSGFDPYKNVLGGCDTFTNFLPLEKSTAIPLNDSSGYYTGFNNNGITAFAEKFNILQPVMLYGVLLQVAEAGKLGGIIISILNDDKGPGNEILSQKYLPVGSFSNGSKKFIDFYPPLEITGNFYISYELVNSTSDTFVIAQSPFRDVSTKNSAWLKKDGSWVSFSNYDGYKNASLDIRASYCYMTDAQIVDTSLGPNIKITPNPSSGLTVIELPYVPKEYVVDYTIVDLTGKKINGKAQITNNYFIIDISLYTKGFYIIFVKEAGKIYTGKIIKS